MDVAIRGDRASCLTMQLAPASWLFAVAQGFGSIGGVPSAPATLERVRSECDRRMRTERFRRSIGRPQGAATALLGVLARINTDLFAQSAAHDDYVPAGCSFSAALIVNERVYVLHAGGTAVYLAHNGEVATLTGDDSFEDSPYPLLARALGTTQSLDMAVSSASLELGDVVILVAHRVRGQVDRRSLIAHVEAAGSGEHLLVVRYDNDGGSDFAHVPTPKRPSRSVRQSIAAFVAVVFALIATIGWAR